MWMPVFPVQPPPSWISERYQRVLPFSKTSLSSSNNKTQHMTLFCSAIARISKFFIKCYTILLILDEFRHSKLLIWRHAYWGHVMLKSWNWCYPVENLSVHKVIKMSMISLKTKKFPSKECSGGIPPPICNIRVKSFKFRSNKHSVIIQYSEAILIVIDTYTILDK